MTLCGRVAWIISRIGLCIMLLKTVADGQETKK